MDILVPRRESGVDGQYVGCCKEAVREAEGVVGGEVIHRSTFFASLMFYE